MLYFRPLPLILLASLLAQPLLRAEGEAVDAEKADKVKAGYLYNFTKFVSWPERSFASSGAPLVIAIVGQSKIDEMLKAAVDGKAVQGHPILVRTFERYDGNAREALKDCHILFITGAVRPAEALRDVQGRNTLTVSDDAGFAMTGGMIELFLKDRNIAMRVNVKAAEAASLTVSSKLLRLAELVEPRKEE
ncbi:MAG: YfiR family protein [Planctomycetota bacterium]|nr:YfiR family protein [Planctomycetota bacterium]